MTELLQKTNVCVTSEPQRVEVRHSRMVCDLSVFLYIYIYIYIYIYV